MVPSQVAVFCVTPVAAPVVSDGMVLIPAAEVTEQPDAAALPPVTGMVPV